MAELINHPNKYAGRYITTFGYITIFSESDGYGLYLNENDRQYRNTKNAIIIGLVRELEESDYLGDFDTQYVKVKGVFNAKWATDALYSGGIFKIDFISLATKSNH